MTDNLLTQGSAAPAQKNLSVPFAEGTTVPDAQMGMHANGFVALGLVPQLVQAVTDMGYTQPTQVQQRAIPLAMGEATGNDCESASDASDNSRFIDLMVSSQTGSGKTAAFLLPVLHTLLAQQAQADAAARDEFERATLEAAARGEAPPKCPRRKSPNMRQLKAAEPGALVLCPTRELAQQVAQDAIGLVKHCKGLRIACIVGGMRYREQIAKLQNANLVVATPGRLLDLQRSAQIKLDKVQFLVVDEADRMLDLGFSDDLAEVNQLTAQRRQTMMFSATFAPRIQKLALRVMHDGGSGVHKIQIDTPQEKHTNIEQKLYWADNPQHKRQLLDHWLRDASIDQAIVFASTQVECDGLANDLQQDGFSAVALHGALGQGLRNRRLMALRSGKVQILVATDVAARGIDVPTITHVFNYGLPMKAEDYTHRIGRTGRAGRDGLAVTFAEFRDRRKIFDIEGYSHQSFKAETVAGLEPTQRFPQGGSGRRGERGDFGAGRGGRGGYGRSETGDSRRFGGGRGGYSSGGRRDSFGAAERGSSSAAGYRSKEAARFGEASRTGYGERAPRGEFSRGGNDFAAPRNKATLSKKPQGMGKPYTPYTPHTSHMSHTPAHDTRGRRGVRNDR